MNATTADIYDEECFLCGTWIRDGGALLDGKPAHPCCIATGETESGAIAAAVRGARVRCVWYPTGPEGELDVDHVFPRPLTAEAHAVLEALVDMVAEAAWERSAGVR